VLPSGPTRSTVTHNVRTPRTRPTKLLMPPTRKEVLRQIDIVRGGLRIPMSTIRKMKPNQKVDTAAVLRKLGAIRSEAKGVMDRAAGC
jgi:hypothetical protein